MATDTPDADHEQLHAADLLPEDRDRATPDPVRGEADVEQLGPDDTPRPTEEREAPMALFDDAATLEARWNEIQVQFVDEPRKAVEDADALVAEVMRRLAETFSAERDQMEREWHAGDSVSTEGLRVALQRYRSFFQRLLAA